MADEEILRLSTDSRLAEEGARLYGRSIDEERGAGVVRKRCDFDLEERFRGLAAAAGNDVTRNLDGLARLARTTATGQLYDSASDQALASLVRLS